MVSVVGWSAPAPSPCDHAEGDERGHHVASPHSAEPARNSPMPVRNTGLRPSRSASFPETSTPSVEAKRNAENTHE